MKKVQVVDTDLLNERIEKSGLKTSFIAEKIGVSRQAFDKKRKGESSFRISELYVICDLLGISDGEDKEKIFYPKS